MAVTLVEIVVWALMLGGVFFAVVGGIGLVRLPDLFSRMHASGMTDTLGAGLILTGLLVHSFASTILLKLSEHPEHGVSLNGVTVYEGSGLVAVKVVAILAFLFITSPTATHALARSALHQQVRPWTVDKEDRPSNG